MTLENLKFDLRIYVLVTGTTTLNAYLCDEGLARFCTEPYEAPTKDNFNDFFKHSTNYSINKHHDDYKETYDEDNTLNNMYDNSKRTLTSCMSSLEAAGIDVEQVKANIKDTCMKAM